MRICMREMHAVVPYCKTMGFPNGVCVSHKVECFLVSKDINTIQEHNNYL